MLTNQKINEILAGIDFHLKKAHELREDLQEIKHAIDLFRNQQEKDLIWEIEKLRTEIKSIKTELQKRGLPEANYYESQYQELKESLKNWPIAVNPNQICQDTTMKKQRSIGILNFLIGEDLKDKKFLDFGCGDNKTVEISKAKFSIGYDIKPNNNVCTNFENIIQNGPYDVILMHDVLDHIENITPVTALQQVKSVLKQNGRIYIKNHPWCSKHGGHLYQQINKAYLHLIFDEVELTRIRGYVSEHNLKIVTPLETYKEWFEEANLQIKSTIPITSPIERFFTEPSHVRERLMKLWNGNELAMISNMEIEFVEYVIENKSNKQIF